MYGLKKKKKIMITVTPCAKINLGLNITSKRTDGYHNLETVFCPVPIYDTITISKNGAPEGTCSLNIKGLEICGNAEDNLIVKAYRALCKERPLPGMDITLEKSIPTQAGMGGGSADCAFALKAINRLSGLGLSESRLAEIAARLGADCPFFIKAQPCYAEGIGERMTPMELSLDNYWIAVVKPPIPVSTKEAFAGIRPHEPQICCRDIVTKEPIENWRGLLKNDFEETIFKLHPQLAAIKERLYADGALYAAMSGSGSALFGLFSEKPELSAYEGCKMFVSSMRGAAERFPIVNDRGEVVGETSRAFAHSGAKPLHPVVHLHVFNSKGELYLQKRPEWKDIQPGKWDTAVGGHIDLGENVDEALKRETIEELGISDFSAISMGSYVFESSREKELVNVFRTTYDKPISPSRTELAGGKFFSENEIAQNIGKDIFTPNFEKEWLKLFGNDSIKK